MPEWLESLILGAIQGLTEFLPVSSSGHLELAKFVLGYDAMQGESLLMTVTLHAATALATIYVFRRDVLDIVLGLFRRSGAEERAFSLKILISMVPAALVGLFMEDRIELLFDEQILLVSCMLLITGLLLYFADRARNTRKKVGYWDSLIIGLAQAIAIIPGISRSGATISSSVLLGNDRDRAARFSFLMVVPLILGKMVLEIKDGELSATEAGNISLLLGFAAAFFTGVLACRWMILLVRKAKLSYFSYYCFAVGLGFIIWTLV